MTDGVSEAAENWQSEQKPEAETERSQTDDTTDDKWRVGISQCHQTPLVSSLPRGARQKVKIMPISRPSLGDGQYYLKTAGILTISLPKVGVDLAARDAPRGSAPWGIPRCSVNPSFCQGILTIFPLLFREYFALRLAEVVILTQFSTEIEWPPRVHAGRKCLLPLRKCEQRIHLQRIRRRARPDMGQVIEILTGGSDQFLSRVH